MTRIAMLTLLLWAVRAGALDLSGAPALGSPLVSLDRELFKCSAAAPGVRCRLDPARDVVFEKAAVRALVLYYRDGVLVRSAAAFDESRFGAVLESLTARLGAGEARPEKLKAGMGGAFPNRVYVWRDHDTVIMLEQYFERVVHSGVSVMGDSELHALTAERNASRVRGARDL